MFRWIALALIGAILLGATLMAASMSKNRRPAPPRDELSKLKDAGNFKEAYEGYRARLIDDRPGDPLTAGEDLTHAIECLRNLGRINEIDAFRDRAVAIHGQNWRLLQAAAESLLNGESFGFIIAGKFERGSHRGGGRYVMSAERDRALALRWLNQGSPLALKDDNRAEAASFFSTFADAVMHHRQGPAAWRLLELTDWSELPDYDDASYSYNPGDVRGAPTNPQGDPIFHRKPSSLAESQTDGERWRYLLEMVGEIDPARRLESRIAFADFLHDQFGVQTMAMRNPIQWGGMGAPDVDADADADAENEAGQEQNQEPTGPFATHTLNDDETIARLANGLKRFKLPDEFNYIRIYRAVISEGKSPQGEHARDALGQIFLNRRQYPKAVAEIRDAIAQYGPGASDERTRLRNQIVGGWGRFETTREQPAGKPASLEYRFRNGKRVEFKAYPINMAKLFEDAKAYLKTKPRDLDYEKFDIRNLGHRLVYRRQNEYVKPAVATWSVDLTPKPDHVDSVLTVHTPLTKAGGYLITAVMEDGNIARTIVFLNDLAIVQKAIDGQTLFFICDAVTGLPVPKANVEFFGWQVRYEQNPNGRATQRMDVTNFAESSDDDGLIVPDRKLMPANYQWMAAGRAGGRESYLGLHHIFPQVRNDYTYNQVKTYVITDRPVYRPEQTVKFKAWTRLATYGNDQAGGQGRPQFANSAFRVEVYDPKGQKFFEKEYRSDEYGGINGEFEIASSAALGSYSLQIVGRGGASFRIEEYKKPEFEVSVDAPKVPIKLGETFEATIKAKYYFGAPVTKAKVSYKITRTSKTATWYPGDEWDWFYGPGYWWFGQDYPWYPGFRTWGCLSPLPWWRHRSPAPPEVVAQAEAAIGPDGALKVSIDTAAALASHPDQDHEYQITAEVTDESRRTITGSGQVTVARKPFRVFVWLDRGYYRTGDPIQVHIQARTPDGKPVAGKGKLKLLRISYDDNAKPIETPVREDEIVADEEGRARLQLKADQPGQYRVSCVLTDSQGRSIEGGYIFLTRGEGFDGGDFRFNPLELIAEKRDYAPGETVKLVINTRRADSTVLLFIKPVNGIALAPKVLRIKGKSTVQDIGVKPEDMPNFFIEAVTVSDSQIHDEMREIAVPPVKKVINVQVEPSKTQYRPGEPAKVKLTLTDAVGERIQGSMALTIYDKSVEYISGGSNVPDIKEAFWKWRRQHNPGASGSLGQIFGNLLRENETPMNDLGLFGGMDPFFPQNNGMLRVFSRGDAMMGGMGGGGMGGGGMPRGGMLGAMPMRAEATATAPAAPAAASLESLGKANSEMSLDAAFAQSPSGPGAGAAAVQPAVRSAFADTAFWTGSLTTAQDGTAEIELKMPENLSGWKVRAWAMGKDAKVGEGTVEVVTVKNLLVRMQAPRFFVETDEVVLSANIRNDLKSDKDVQAILELGSSSLRPLGETQRTIRIKSGDEARVDWRVKAEREGEAIVRMKALTDEESDAMEMKFPVYVHGAPKMDSFAGTIRPEGDEGSIAITIPEKRRVAESRLEVRYSPTLAGAMVDALPYLADYPYGCTEQTLNRFLPTVITQSVLKRMNIDLNAVREKRTNLNAQELGDDRARAERWRRYDRNPVFDPTELARMVKVGVADLTEMQLSDGGWGWFSGYGEHSSPHTTAVVVHGLQIARANGVAIVPGVLERGTEWLKTYQARETAKLVNAAAKTEPYKTQADDVDALVFMVLADADVADPVMRDFLDRDRAKLSLYAVAMYGIALQKQGQAQKLAQVLRNLKQYLVVDDENQTAYLKLPNEGYWWFWHGSEIETMAFYLKLLAKTDPQGDVAPKLVKYLLNNRKHATYWNSTRDTAYCIEAFSDYMAASGEDQPDMTVEILVDGQKRQEVKINAQNLFSFKNAFVLEGEAVTGGKHQITLRKQGRGPLYFNAYASYFTLEDRIDKSGLEIKVERKFYKLVKRDAKATVGGARGQVLKQNVEAYDRQPIADLSVLKSGDLVEIELEMESKNDYEYLIFEDYKAAGFEPVEVRSGYNGNDIGAYVEFRDEKVAFLTRWLARGKHSVSYRLRAEIPGQFSALPAQASAMYAPELRGNSDEFKVRIAD